MIRERVATDGVCRPLEAESELSAMTMPEDEVGVIKEGPATRYLKGQALWDKRFRHALKSVARHRTKNLEDAHNRDAGKIVRMWQDREQKHREERHRAQGNGSGSGGETDDDESEGGMQYREDLLDQSWSWSWAMEGEAPPASAIVSRRDYVSISQRSMCSRSQETDE